MPGAYPVGALSVIGSAMSPPSSSLRDLPERELGARAGPLEDPDDVKSVVWPGRRHDPGSTDERGADRRDEVMLPGHEGDAVDLGQGLGEWLGVAFEEPGVDSETEAGSQRLDGFQRASAAAVQPDP